MPRCQVSDYLNIPENNKEQKSMKKGLGIGQKKQFSGCSLKSSFYFVLLFIFSFSLQAEGRAIPITSQPLSELLKDSIQSAPATAESLNRSQLSAQISAQILTILVKVGDVVSRGTLLLELDCRDAQLALKQSQSRMKFAQHQLKRSQTLHKSKNVSDEQHNQRQTEFELAQLDIRQQQLQVSRCRITAPFDGVVVARHVAEGELATPGTKLLSLLDTGRVEVVASVLLDQVNEVVKAGQRWFESQNIRYPLHLRAVVQDVNTRARNRILRFDFSDEKALPGTPGRLKWQAALPVLPAEYLVRRDKGMGIFVLEDGHARFLTLNNANEGQAAPVDLPAQTRVIIDGRFSLKNGDAVNEVTYHDVP